MYIYFDNLYNKIHDKSTVIFLLFPSCCFPCCVATKPTSTTNGTKLAEHLHPVA